MDFETVISRQALKIEELQDRIAILERARSNAMLEMICIGGPLNDNKLQYSNAQLSTFARMRAHLDV